MNDMNANAFDLTVSALRDKGLNSDEILEELSKLFQNLSGEGHTENEPKLFIDRQKEDNLRDLFTQLGVPRHLKGYRYLHKSVMIYAKNPGAGMTTEVYPMVAKEFQTTASRVERTMRHAVEIAWERCEWEVLYKIFGNTVSHNKGKPTNSEFMARCAELLNLEE